MRYESGWLSLSGFPNNQVPSADSQQPRKPFPTGLGETVRKFYEAADRGLYKEAYQLALENKWQAKAPDTYALAGLTSQDEFVHALTEQWGDNGVDLTINEMDLLSASPLGTNRPLPSEWPELYTLADLPADTLVEDIYEVQIHGSLMERCSLWQWDKRLLVAKLTPGEWKVLLPGIPDNRISHIQVWFLDKNPFAELHILQEK